MIAKCRSIKTISVTLDNQCFYNSIENGWAITSSRSPYLGMLIPASITSLVNQVSVRNMLMVLGTILTLSLGYLWSILVWSGYPLYWGVLSNHCEASQCRGSFGYYGSQKIHDSISNVISLTIGFARNTIITLPTIHYPLYHCLVMFYIVLSKAVLHYMILLTVILYYILW